MFKDELTLIKKTITSDNLGNQIPSEVESTVFCNKLSVSRSEFYFASNTAFKPSIIFEMNSFEYEGQTIVKFDGKRYKIIRTYDKKREKIELVCERG